MSNLLGFVSKNLKLVNLKLHKHLIVLIVGNSHLRISYHIVCIFFRYTLSSRNRSELMRRFKQSSLDMPVNKVNDLLKSLLEDGDIYTERGEKNAVKYFVKND